MSCPYHGYFQRNCTHVCQNHHHRMTEQEAEEEMMMTALTITNSVLDEPEEIIHQAEMSSNGQEEPEMELFLSISNLNRWGNHYQISTHPPTNQRWSQQETPCAPLAIQGTRNPLVGGQAACTCLILDTPTTNVITENSGEVVLGVLVGFLIFSNPSTIMPTPRREVATELQPDSPYYGLHPMYHNYRYVPVKFFEEHQWPPTAVSKQLEELHINRGKEDIVLWQEGQSENDRCVICLTNVATRIAVPCGHKQSCRECISRVIVTTKSNKRYLQRLSNGEMRATCYDIPVRCLICRCILGMIVVNY